MMKSKVIISGIIGLFAISQFVSATEKIVKTYPIPTNVNYLSLPVMGGGEMRQLKIFEKTDNSKKLVHIEQVALSPEKPDWIASLDLTRFSKKPLELSIELPKGTKYTPEFTDTLAIAKHADYMKEPNRPLFHYTAPFGRINDPNGLVYWQGKWHAFCQYCPTASSRDKSPKSWLYAESEDLVHWFSKREAILPVMKPWGLTQAYSGTAYADNTNKSGLFSSSKGGVIFCYTRTGIGECLAYTEDFVNFKEVDFNPIIRDKGRDPHLFFHKPTNKWVIFRYNNIGDEKILGNRVFSIWTSDNLKDWKKESTIEGSRYECPDVFEISKKGSSKKIWACFEAVGKYSLGKFDGKKFTPIGETRELFPTRSASYAGQTFDNVADGRVIMMTFIGTRSIFDYIKMPFLQNFSIPMEIFLKNDSNDKPALFAQPVKEIYKSFSKPKSILKSKEIATSSISEIEVELKNDDAEFTINIADFAIFYNAKKSSITIRENFGTKKECAYNLPPLKKNKVSFKIVLDKLPIEIFWNNGERAIFTVGDFRGEKVPLKFSGKNAVFKKFDNIEFKK